MKKILNTIWVMGVLTLAVFCLSACDRDLDVQQSLSVYGGDDAGSERHYKRTDGLRYAVR